MASFKGQKANNAAPMRVDGTAAYVIDKAVLGASPGLGTPVATDTIDFRISAGSILTELAFQLDDCDTGSAFVFGVGYRAVDTNSSLTPSSTYFAAAGQTTGQILLRDPGHGRHADALNLLSDQVAFLGLGCALHSPPC